nr:hypothetical protein [uncultured Holophaga sp.]
MKPETIDLRPADPESFDLLEHPELWPDDPARQAELAALLELHLGLVAHGREIAPPSNIRRIGPRWHQGVWLPLAAAILLAMIPTVIALRHMKHIQDQSRDQARIELVARNRAQERLWATFFQQSSDLLKDFQRRTSACSKDKEDRSSELLMAQTLLRASHQLAAQGSPSPEAEALRTDLHAWLTEFSLEDGCLDPDRAQELRHLAEHRDLEDASQRQARVLDQGGR